jgi:hypothetical protein
MISSVPLRITDGAFEFSGSLAFGGSEEGSSSLFRDGVGSVHVRSLHGGLSG